MITNRFFYKDVLKVYNDDCVLYDTSLYGTDLEIGHSSTSGNLFVHSDYDGPQGFNTRFCWNVAFATIVAYILVFIGTIDGTKSIRVVSWISLPIQGINIALLVLTGMTLANSHLGIKMYLFGEEENAEGEVINE